MKWETYNQMTRKQKEEYNYRFGDDEPLTPPNIFPWVIVTYLIGMTYMMVVLLISKEIITLKQTALQTLHINMNITIYPMIIYIAIYVVLTIFDIIGSVKKEKWLKERGIK